MKKDATGALLEAIFKRQHAGDNEGLTTWELAEACNLSGSRVLEKLRKAVRAGCITVQCGKRPYVYLDGRKSWVPVYRIKFLEKKK